MTNGLKYWREMPFWIHVCTRIASNHLAYRFRWTEAVPSLQRASIWLIALTVCGAWRLGKSNHSRNRKRVPFKLVSETVRSANRIKSNLRGSHPSPLNPESLSQRMWPQRVSKRPVEAPGVSYTGPQLPQSHGLEYNPLPNAGASPKQQQVTNNTDAKHYVWPPSELCPPWNWSTCPASPNSFREQRFPFTFAKAYDRCASSGRSWYILYSEDEQLSQTVTLQTHMRRQIKYHL